MILVARLLPMLKVIPQDLSRAVLNVMNNACYAVYSKSKLSPINKEYETGKLTFFRFHLYLPVMLLLYNGSSDR